MGRIVVTETLERGEWENTTILSGDPTQEIRALKAQVDGTVGVTGSITLVHHLIAAELVDEYRLFVYPVVAGGGRRLFESITQLHKLQIVETKQHRSGVVLLSYRPAAR